MANLFYLCGSSLIEAMCMVGCNSIYTNQASKIAKELITGGCLQLAMVEAGNQLPNVAPFPARPPPPPPALVPAHGVAFRQSGSPTSSSTHRDAEHAKTCPAAPAAVEISNHHIKDVYSKESIHGTRTEIEFHKPMGRHEGDPQIAHAAASQRFQQDTTTDSMKKILRQKWNAFLRSPQLSSVYDLKRLLLLRQKTPALGICSSTIQRTGSQEFNLVDPTIDHK